MKNKKFAGVTYFFMIVFLGLVIYLGWFVFFKSDAVINNNYNKRTDTYAARVTRGKILSSDGEILARTTEDSDGNEIREYPFGKVFAHIVGYTTQGSYGLESIENFYMLRSHSFFLTYMQNEVSGNKNLGDNIVTSLDSKVQKVAYDALGDYDGAVVLIQPSTGRIISMVSKPAFDPNTLEEDWETITSADSEDSVLINRATQGLYPPGSTFKIFATLEYLREHNYDASDFVYDCDGKIKNGNLTIHCYNNSKHGEISLKTAFAKSCNCAFASLYDVIDIGDYCDLVNNSLFNTSLPTALECNKSSFSLNKNSDTKEIMQTLIGQGNTLVSPFHMALIMCAIDNNGILMKPKVADKVENDAGDTVEEFAPERYGRIFTEEDCKVLKKYMRNTVKNGTASKLADAGYKAYGKTGSAEFSDTEDSAHAWFVGFASKEGYEDVAICVLVEDSGSGSKYAVPVARKVLDEYFDE